MAKIGKSIWGGKSYRAEHEYSDFTTLHKAMNVTELDAYRRKIAKTANQRLLRLERESAKREKSGRTPINFSNMGAVTWLKGKGRKRFRETLAKDPDDIDFESLRDEITIITNFLNAESSSVLGRKEIAEKIKRTYRDKGIDINNEALDAILDHFDDIKGLAIGYNTALSNLMAVADDKTDYQAMTDLIKKIKKTDPAKERELREQIKESVKGNDKFTTATKQRINSLASAIIDTSYKDKRK